jgi:nitroreductase
VGTGLFFILLAVVDCSIPFLPIMLVVAALGLSSGFIPGYNTRSLFAFLNLFLNLIFLNFI